MRRRELRMRRRRRRRRRAAEWGQRGRKVLHHPQRSILVISSDNIDQRSASTQCFENRKHLCIHPMHCMSMASTIQQRFPVHVPTDEHKDPFISAIFMFIWIDLKVEVNAISYIKWIMLHFIFIQLNCQCLGRLAFALQALGLAEAGCFNHLYFYLLLLDKYFNH